MAARAAIALASVAMLTAWAFGPAPLLARLLPLVVLFVGLRQPSLSVIVLAGWAPVCGLVGVWLGMEMPGVRLLEQVAFATVAAIMVREDWRSDLRLLWPGACLALVVVASALVVQPVWLLTFEHVPSWAALGRLFAEARVFDGTPDWQPTTTAARMLLGIGVAVSAEASLRRRPERLESVIGSFGVGAAVAASYNLERLFELHGGMFGREVLEALSTARINTQTDINAGGSLFALASLVLLGFFSVSRRLRWGTVLPLAVILVGGLWLSGSRSALATAAVAVTGTLIMRAWVSRGAGRWRLLAASGAIVAMSAGVVALYPATRNFSLSGSVESRRIFAEAALRMWSESPADGVGIGTFYGRSADYGAGKADAILVTGRTSENAHNYPLQLLAELGLLGLLPYLLLTLPTIWQGVRSVTSPMVPWIAAGLAAYLGSSLTGHPQLLSETVIPFWLMLGSAASHSIAASPACARIGASATVGTAVLLSVTPGVRAERVRDIAVLEHRGIGLSRAQHDSEGHRFRMGTEASLVFVPTGATLTLPLSLESQSSPPVVVRVYVDDIEVNRLEISSRTWTDLRLSIRPARRKYVALRLVSDQGLTFRFGRVDAKPLE